MNNVVSVKPLRVAIVGCGAVAERLHLPALADSASIHVTALVDPDPQRLQLLAAGRPGIHASPTTRDLERYAEAAIVAVPHHLHRGIATDLLERGLHVFVEKPLATSLEDADALVETACRTGRRIGVGLVRRQYLPFRFVQSVLQQDWLGRLRSFDWREGNVFSWPVASTALFRRDQGGGVLFDTGAHSLDTLLAWLGEFESVIYRDDEQGGVEANCVIDVTLRNGVTGIVELSRTRNLRNTCILKGERGELEVGFSPNSEVVLRAGGLTVKGPAADSTTSDLQIHDAVRRQLELFAKAVQASGEPPVSARAARESVRMFDACRRSRQPLELPWTGFNTDADIDWSRFAGTRVLVLGGTGFIGSRLVECLAQKGDCRIRLMARTLSKLAPVARYPVEIVHGDAGDTKALEDAMEGCDYVFNCAYGKGPRDEQRRVNVDAVRSMIHVAGKLGVKQVVHISTVSVYGAVDGETLNESSPARASKRNAYGYTKWKGEEVALAEGRRLRVPVAVVQPPAVYGPGAPTWTLHPLRLLRSGRVVLVNGGRGVSNAVYVDDVVTALLQAAITPQAAGERFLVRGPDVVTWGDFFGAYGRMLNCDNVLAMSARELEIARRLERKRNGNIARARAILRAEYQGRPQLIELPIVATLRNIVRRVVPRSYIEAMKGQVIPYAAQKRSLSPRLPLHLPDRELEAVYGATAVIDYAKAARLINYRPAVNLETGMQRVAAWARWANLL